MDFRKTSKGGGVIFNQKIYVADFGPLYRAFFVCFRKKIATKFSKYEREVKGRLEFFQISSDLEA